MWINPNVPVTDGPDNLDEIAGSVKPVRVGRNPATVSALGRYSLTQPEYLASIAAGINDSVRPNRAVVVLTNPPDVAHDIARGFVPGSNGLNPRPFLEKLYSKRLRGRLEYNVLNDRLQPSVGHVGVLVVKYK